LTATERAEVVDRLQGSMPQAMRELPQWLLWRFEADEKRPEKPRKVPYYVSGRRRRGEQGTTEDRAELARFEVALGELRRGRWDGLGFAFLPGDGLVGIDIDRGIDGDTGEISARTQQIVDACASYTEASPSGTGVHVIVKGDTTTFKDNRVGVEVFCGRQFFTCTGRRWPGTTADVQPIAPDVLERLRSLVERSKARGRSEAAPARAAGSAAPDLPLRERLEAALQYLAPDPDYGEWIQVGMALKAALGEAGLAVWDYWSAKGAKYPGAQLLARKWASFKGDGVTEATVFKLAIAAGWTPPKAPRPTRQRAQPNAGGEAPAKTVSTPSRRSAGEGESDQAAPPGDDPPPVDQGAGDEPDDWRSELIRANGGGKKDCRENVFLVLQNHPELRGLVGYDEFAHRVMKLRPPPWKGEAGEWSTNDDYMLGFWLAKHERMNIKSEGTLVAGVAMAALHNTFHPVHNYLNGLAAWDGTPRLRHWLHECLGAADSDYTSLVGAWFLMGMVNRVLNPGCQMDYMVVLEGLQGKRKSTALRTLVGNDDWFADTPIRVGDKDALLSLAGKWLYEIGELEAFNRAEVTAVKQYVSSRIDRVREPFARRPVDRKRSGVFSGSTNAGEYFKDPTGARRFWPVACNGEIDVPKLATWRDQLYAEALHRLRSDDEDERRYWPTREETERFLAVEQERRQIGDPWFDRLATWVDSKAAWDEVAGGNVCDQESFTSYELLLRGIGVAADRMDGARQMATRVGTIMHALGWEKRRDGSGDRLWRYHRPKTAAQLEREGQAQRDGLHEF
jgi:putative DNA primase/helicase